MVMREKIEENSSCNSFVRPGGDLIKASIWPHVDSHQKSYGTSRLNILNIISEKHE